VDPLLRTRKNRALFGSGVADGDYRSERLACKFGDGFGALDGNVNPDLAHNLNGEGIDAGWLCAGTMNLHRSVTKKTEQAFGHLASSGITGAQD
jgi:hypothetical protein